MKHYSQKTKHFDGFSLTELMVVLVIIGVLVLLALPKLLPIVTKAKTTEAKLMLKQVYTLEQSYKFEHDHYSQALVDIGFDQEKLIAEGGQARYKIEVATADDKGFTATATSAVDFNLGYQVGLGLGFSPRVAKACINHP